MAKGKPLSRTENDIDVRTGKPYGFKSESLGLGDELPPQVKADIEQRVEEAQNQQQNQTADPALSQQAMSPCQVFEANVNNYLAQFGHMIPFTELVGFLELKLIELKESYRFTTEMNIRKNMEANEHGHTH